MPTVAAHGIDAREILGQHLAVDDDPAGLNILEGVDAGRCAVCASRH
jgi:hypothetical protein